MKIEVKTKRYKNGYGFEVKTRYDNGYQRIYDNDSDLVKSSSLTVLILERVYQLLQEEYPSDLTKKTNGQCRNSNLPGSNGTSNGNIHNGNNKALVEAPMKG